ncbi:hypothetical protein [Bacillus sp. MMSF_3328]|uniref:hypothetical protein n=1 Tax=Bacillus sp. MMSF_3328 TaxID=3047080 RepID=UPI00273EF420|nr:hypothetical protein [Bacillus sp. MMSF_3328]
MAEESSFFNSVNGDRQYDMEQFALYFKQFLSNGLYHTNSLPALLVRPDSGMATLLESGSAYIEGFMYRNTEEIRFTHDPADVTNPRIDRIVLRLDKNLNARHIKAFIKKGTPGTIPIPPTLQRDETVYEISLAQVKIDAGKSQVTSVIDERLNPEVAGLVSSLITVPTEQFVEEWNRWMVDMNLKKENYQREWESWFQGIQVQNPAMGGITFYTGKSAPSIPALNDRWLDTN